MGFSDFVARVLRVFAVMFSRSRVFIDLVCFVFFFFFVYLGRIIMFLCVAM